MKTETIDLDSVPVTGLVFTWGDKELKYWDKPNVRRYDDPSVPASSFTVSDDSFDDSPFFCFWVEDCYQPSLHIIRARSFEDAYETFCELEADRGHYLIVDGDEDYNDEDGTWTDDGRRVDSESFNGCEIQLKMIVL